MRFSASVRLLARLFVIEEIRVRVTREMLKVDVDESFGILRLPWHPLRGQRARSYDSDITNVGSSLVDALLTSMVVYGQLSNWNIFVIVVVELFETFAFHFVVLATRHLPQQQQQQQQQQQINWFQND
uniref:Uncharacterized protein n=1 Tax=Glossina austeni TaxID=7395 RepID=A0A1A9VKS8_GLOAU